MSHNPTDILDTILERLRSLATTETIVGKPVQVDNLTVLPVIKLSVGFASGGAEGKGEKDKSGGTGTVGGGGGGASVNPVGFITFDGEKVKFVAVGKGKIETLFETVPEVLKKVGLDMSKFSGKGKDKKDQDDKDEEEKGKGKGKGKGNPDNDEDKEED